MAPKVSEAYKHERRSRLLDSALHCFGEKGYDATTVDEIVQHAGVSKGMVYNYFSSKEEIFLQLLDEQTAAFFKAVSQELSGYTNAEEKLRHLIQRFREAPVTEAQRKWTSVHIEFYLHATRDPSLRSRMDARYERFVQFLAEIVKQGQQSGVFRSDLSSEAVAGLFWALRDGIALHFLQLDDASSRDRVWDSAQELMFRYLT